MEFSRLRVSGFKSFCDPVELDIASGLTGIVGPNGCGKSNIVEALRWVMGETSAKGLRGSEMSDVIFAGSSLRSAYDMAEVSVLVKKPGNQAKKQPAEAVLNGAGPNEQGLAEAPATFELEELEIARRISRGAGSAYRINGREARARDVHLVFADAGAGARSPAIISQGQVGFVVEAKPEDRRRLLEDAAGIGGLHSRRREAELKLAATERNLERVGDRIADQDERLGDLRRQSKQAERYRKLQEQIRELEVLTILARLQNAEKAREGAQNRLNEATAEHARAAHASREAEQSRSEIEKGLPSKREAVALATALTARAEERLATLDATKRQHEREIALLEEQISEIDVRLGAHKSQAETSGLRGLECDEQGKKTAARLEELQQILTGLRDREPELTQTMTEGREHVQALERDFATAEARHQTLKANEVEWIQRRNTLKLELERLESVDDDALVEVAARQLKEAEAEQEKSERELTSVNAEIAKFDEERGSALGRVEACREVQAQALAEKQRLDNAVTQAREKARAQTSQTARLARDQERLDTRLQAIADEIEGLALEGKQADFQKLRQSANDLENERQRLSVEAGEASKSREELSAKNEANQSALGEAERSLERALAEQAALQALQTDNAEQPIIDSFDIPEAWSRALAAALGDDLLLAAEDGSLGFWRELANTLAPGDLPEGSVPLSAHIGAPSLLRRRLQSIGVCPDAETAAELQGQLHQGQRLVTANGGLWRWDGLVRLPGQNDPSELRVLQRRRLAALHGEIRNLRNRAEKAKETHEESRTNLQNLEKKLQGLREALSRTGMEKTGLAEKQTQLSRAIEAGKAAILRLEAERAALGDEKNLLDQERQRLGAIDPKVIDALLEEQQIAKQRLHGFNEQLETNRSIAGRCDHALVSAKERHRVLEQRSRDALQATTKAQIVFERRLGEADVRKAHRTTATATLGEDCRKADFELNRIHLELEALGTALFERRSGVKAAGEQLASRTAALEALRREVSERAAEHSVLEERAVSLTGEHNRLIEEQGNAIAAIEPLSQKRVQLVQDLAERRSEHGPGARLEELGREVAGLQEKLKRDQTVLGTAEAQFAQITEQSRRLEAQLAGLHEKMALAGAESERLDGDVQAIVVQAQNRLTQPIEELLSNNDIQEALKDANISILEDRLQKMTASRERIGPVNLRAALEAEERESELLELQREEEELRVAVERLKSGISTLNREARERLKEVFVRVDDHFRRLFGKLFAGGKAHLRLTNLDDPLNCGLELEAMPPGKKLQNISLLSGGEKSLTALALIFAFFLSEPSPLCVLDEVDAALDDANVERFVVLMEEIARETGTRFVVVTHHPFTMARMDRLFGVTMIERGVSRLVSVALDEAVEIGARA